MTAMGALLKDGIFGSPGRKRGAIHSFKNIGVSVGAACCGILHRAALPKRAASHLCPSCHGLVGGRLVGRRDGSAED